MPAGLLGDGKRGVEADVRSERLQMFNMFPWKKEWGLFTCRKTDYLDIIWIACIYSWLLVAYT